MSLLSFFGISLWNDVRDMKQRWITREEFNAGLEGMKGERDVKHSENTGNFRRLEEKIQRADDRHYESSLAIEQRLGELAERIAKLRPHRPGGAPERRSDY
jgi:hypothetical protein